MTHDKRDERRATPVSEETLPLIEEEVNVGKREIVKGRLRVRTVTDAVEQIVREELSGERVGVERVSLERLLQPGEPAPEVRTEDGVTILPVLEEVLVIEKRLLLKEELRITRHATTEFAEVPVTLRKQRAVVERLDPETKKSTNADQPLDEE